MSAWKQPIPTDESEFPKESLFTLYSLLVLKSCNKDGFVVVGNNKLIPIKRGQTIFGRNKWSKYFDTSPSRVERLLKTLENRTSKVTCTRTMDCTIVTIKNYDEVVQLEQANVQAVNKLRTSYEQAMNTSKNVKSVESVKNIKPVQSPTPPIGGFDSLSAFNDFWNMYPRKEGRKTVELKYTKLLATSPELQTKIMDSLTKHIEIKWKDTERKFIPMPLTWINQERWNDEIEGFKLKAQISWM